MKLKGSEDERGKWEGRCVCVWEVGEVGVGMRGMKGKAKKSKIKSKEDDSNVK